MKMANKPLWLSGLGLMFLLTACAGTAPNVLNVQAGPDGVSAKQVEVHDMFLARTISIGDVSVQALDSGNAIEAQVLVRNASSRDVPFEYRFMWYDSKGFEISSATAWLPASLGGKETRGFKSAAPARNAAGFRFAVRKPHPVNEAGSY